jgi:hypothetical protein
LDSECLIPLIEILDNITDQLHMKLQLSWVETVQSSNVAGILSFRTVHLDHLNGYLNYIHPFYPFDFLFYGHMANKDGMTKSL